ncbi:MAG: cyclic nucleotide-binding domain-containing protein [Chloroflexi bacterium]|nr:cyclic nucleotide-binding domain-containing protein [Chloroflexota bacterium]
MTDPADIVRSVFDGLDDHAVATVCANAVQKTYPVGAVLCREGAVEHTFYIVMDGLVAVTLRLQDGGTRQLSQRGAGQFFGEMALIERRPRAATVVTTAETTVLEISEHDFNQLVMKNPKVAMSVLRGITANLRASDQAAITDLSRKNVELAKAYADLKAAQEQIVAKEKLEHELDIAARLQQSLLPNVFPKVSGWSFSGRNVPARTIGGDLFDVIPVDDEHVGLLMADVSDKSIHAALFMAVTRSLFLPESRRTLSPRGVALGVHRWLLEVSSDSNMFVTAFYGVLTPATGRLRYVRAGQDKPIWLQRGAEGHTELDGAGRFLGMLEELELEEREVIMSPGDILVMCSDGVPDAVNDSGDNYGQQRLTTLLEEHRADSAKQICDAIFGDVFAFRGAASAFDDITVLIAKADER